MMSFKELTMRLMPRWIGCLGLTILRLTNGSDGSFSGI